MGNYEEFILIMFLDRLAGYAILPAQFICKKNIPLNLERVYKGNCNFINFKVPSVDDGQLDTIVIHPKNLTQNPFYVIYFCGNGQDYIHMVNILRERAEKYGHVAVAFNYSNVGNSTGIVYSQQQLIDNGKAQVQRLLNAGVPADHITLNGMSLGGAIATITAAEFKKEQNLRIRVINDRSFSNIPDVVTSKFQPKNFILKAIHKVFSWVIQGLAKFLNWELDAAKAMESVNVEDVCITVSKQDPVMPYKASFYQAVKPKLKELYQENQYKKLTHSYKVSKHDQWNFMDVHNALSEQLIDKVGHNILDTVNNFVKPM